MRIRWQWIAPAILIVGVVPILTWADSEVKDATISERAQGLRDQIQTIVLAHDSTLEAVETHYNAAAPEERAAIEEEATSLEVQFRTDYLELMLEYGNLVQDDDVVQEAQEQLDWLRAMVESGDSPTFENGLGLPSPGDSRMK
jgi:hypothetical protein